MSRNVGIVALIALSKCGGADGQSQGMQDQVLQEIFQVIGTTNEFYVELGFNAVAHRGGSGSNTFALKERGWRGLLLDGRFSNPDINLHQEMIFSSNAAFTFEKHNVPAEPDYVSIDLDTADIWVFDALARSYRPRVVSIEYNAAFPPASTIAFPGITCQ
jgi:hypothetical protein